MLLPWPVRGLRDGFVTTRYPKKPDSYPQPWWGSVAVARGKALPGDLHCPTGAITGAEQAHLDRGKCILCGRCASANPTTFSRDRSFEVASPERGALVVPASPESEAEVERARARLREKTRSLRRSVHLRHVDAGSDGSEEWELSALTGPVYDIGRLGIFFTASPRHADMLLVTGAGSVGMLGPLVETYKAMPEPRVVIAVGTDAISGGVMSPSYATSGGVGDVLPVDVWVPGSPPSPLSILHGILVGMGRL
jgi:Ni,Fe-hydrogenase III small subunit/ferredoxin